MVSVVIAAHNEEAVIGGCLDALLAQRTDTPLEVVVSANGCTDRTAEAAEARGFRWCRGNNSARWARSTQATLL